MTGNVVRNSVEEMEHFLEGLDRKLLVKVAEYAIKEHEEGRCVSHEQAMEMIEQRMGWK